MPLSFLRTTLRSIQAYQRLMKAVTMTPQMAICSNDCSARDGPGPGCSCVSPSVPNERLTGEPDGPPDASESAYFTHPGPKINPGFML
ncbi:MAG: hypothetical protein MZV64_11200 [Ignavibacteriales bacterium]|nr:hypothetical protein [Ignavibacteriales bacterium]